jgi:hypothetical protein
MSTPKFYTNDNNQKLNKLYSISSPTISACSSDSIHKNQHTKTFSQKSIKNKKNTKENSKDVPPPI